MDLFDQFVGQQKAEREAEQDYEKEVKEKKDASKGRIKLNLGDVILALFGLPPLVSMAKDLKEGGAVAAAAGITGIPVLGDALNTVLKTKQTVPDMLDEAVSATEAKAPADTLNKLFEEIQPLNTKAESAAQPVPGVDPALPSGGHETLNDFLKLIRSLKQ
jgi:hypothetical protein